MNYLYNEYDIVTGLPLYDSFICEAKKVLGDSYKSDDYVLVSTDISNFKYINRIYGYDKANELLKNLITIMKQEQKGLVASCRTHSDHVISLIHYKGNKALFAAEVEEYSREFVRQNAKKYSSVTLHLNNGLYYLIDPDEDLIYSIDKANVARRAAKGNYCVTSVLFADDMMGKKESDAQIIAMFDTSLRANRVRVFFQPKIDIATHEIKGAEALSRMFNNEGEIVQPDVFIPVLENSGKIVELDWYVMKTVFSFIKEWISEGRRVVPVSINLSRMHFYEGQVADRIYNEFLKYQIPIEYIELELTESLFFAESKIIMSEVAKLRQYGFRVSMDDFGVGYSNLNSLGQLPVDIIKFDKGFIQSSSMSEASNQILLSLIKVFRKINFEVICEGVETIEDEKRVFDCGCDIVQGYLYDKPLEVSIFKEKYIK